MAETRNLTVILLRLQQHFGSLESAVEHLDSYTLRLGVRGKRMEQAIQTVCSTFGLTLRELNQSQKKHTPRLARTAVIAILRTHFDAKTEEIARHVPYGPKTINNYYQHFRRMQQNELERKINHDFFEKLERIEQIIKN